MTPVYLDHASTTPVSEAALQAYLTEARAGGNASSLHSPGRRARRVVEESRETLARCVGARPSEVIFTSGGTEADNLAIKGVFWGRRAQNPTRTRVVVSAVEHHAVLDPAFWLAEHAGAEVVLLPVDSDGVVDVDALAQEVDEHAERIALVSVMWANNEIGTIEPIREAARLARRRSVPFHTDAVQAVGHIPVSFANSGVDAMTISGHKLGAPLGVGALVARRDLPLVGTQHGGGQERAVRSGTLDGPAIRAFAVAVEAAAEGLASEIERLSTLQEHLIRGIQQIDPSATLRGPRPGDHRVPGNIHFTFPGCEGDSLLYLLDAHGVAASTGSACQAGVPQPSHVLLACGLSDRDARGALRFTLGATSTPRDIDRVLEVLPTIINRARSVSLP